MRRLTNIVCTALLALAFCWSSVAAGADWGLAVLMDRLGERNSGHAGFSEKKFVAVLAEPIELDGTLTFAPGVLEKITLKPYYERMVVDGDILTIESGVEKRKRRLRLQRYPAVQGFVEGLRATLTGDLDTLQRYYEVQLEGDASRWRLLLTPRQNEMAAAVRQISIDGAHGHISVIEIKQQGGDRSVMKVTEAAS